MVEQKKIKKKKNSGILGDSRKMMFNHHLHHWLFPTYLLFFILPHILSGISYSFLSGISSGILSGRWGPAGNTWRGYSRLRSGREHWAWMVVVEVRQGTLGGDGRGWGPAGNTGRGWSWLRSDREHCASRVAVEQEEEERRGGEEQATDIKSNNPHLAGGEKTWGFPQNDVQPSSSSLALSYIFPFFHTSPHFSHIPFMSFRRNTRWEWLWKGKHSVFIVFFQLAAAHFDFWGVQGISNTPRIIYPLGKTHGMVFNLALSCSDFPNLSYFPLFLPYSLHFPPKNSFLGSVRFW